MCFYPTFWIDLYFTPAQGRLYESLGMVRTSETPALGWRAYHCDCSDRTIRVSQSIETTAIKDCQLSLDGRCYIR